MFMKNSVLFFVLFVSFVSSAQVNPWCATDRIIEQQKLANPNLVDVIHQGFIAANSLEVEESPTRATIYVPTVVHIIHDNGIGNISLEQIDDALRILNEDYNRDNADAVDTRNTVEAPFAAIAGDMDIEFKLAKIDPDGNCTNGIVRVNAPNLTYNAGENCKNPTIGGSGQWPMDRYLNIWVVNSIDSQGEGTTLGYAFYPYGAWGNDGYGVLIRNDAFGTIETAQGADGRTLTHELGHALGLAHIFEGGCQTGDCSQEGDFCCDTPLQSEANWSCNPTWNSCTTIPPGSPYGIDTYDQIENYMSYNACQNMFSADQVTIMQNNFSNIFFLENMISPANIISTGINEPDQLCKVDFISDYNEVCSGKDIQFQDWSYTNPTSWNWSVSPGAEGTEYIFVDGTSSASQNPTIQFIGSGEYNVSLEISDGNETISDTKENFIKVIAQPAQLPFHEGFENYSETSEIEQNWRIVNPQSNAQFALTTSDSYTGNKALKLSNYGQGGQNIDEFISAPIDLSNQTQVTLSFRYAYRKRNASNNEVLKVFVSNDCAESWSQRKTLVGNLLSNLVEPGVWSPESQDDWTTIHVTNITSLYLIDNFRCKFRFEGSGGNNFFLDDINLYSGEASDEIITASLSEISEEIGLNVYPNPAEDVLNINFHLDNAQKANVKILDVSGKLIEHQTISGATGNNTVILGTNTIVSGTYFLNIETEKGTAVVKFIKK